MNAASAPAKTLAWFALAGLCSLLLLVQLWLAFVWMSGDEHAASFALSSGQRLVFSVDGTAYPPQLEKASAEPSLAVSTDETAPPAPEENKQAALLEEFAAAESELPSVQEAPAHSEAESFVASEEELRDVIPAEPRTANSLNAPDADLQEEWEGGVLPMRDGDRTPLMHYSRPFEAPAGNPPKIALLITGLGALRAQTEAASQLPSEVTLGFSSYAQQSETWMPSVRNKGHEAWLMLPAQPDSFPAGDGGPDALLAEQDPEESLMRLKRTLSKSPAYSGVILPADEALSDHLPPLQWLGGQLNSRGLGLIVAKRPSNSAAQGWLRNAQDARSSDVLIDETLTQEAIESQLRALETHAQQHGQALGVIRPYPLSLQMIEPWLTRLKARGFVLAPASALLLKDKDD